MLRCWQSEDIIPEINVNLPETCKGGLIKAAFAFQSQLLDEIITYFLFVESFLREQDPCVI